MLGSSSSHHAISTAVRNTKQSLSIYISPSSSECTGAMISISLGIPPETCYVISKNLYTSAISVSSSEALFFCYSRSSSHGRHIGPQKPAATHCLCYCSRYVLQKRNPRPSILIRKRVPSGHCNVTHVHVSTLLACGSDVRREIVRV